MRQWRAAAAMVAMVVALVDGSQAGAATTTLFVDRSNPACSDAGSGTATQPFCTINAAAARVTAGQTVQVLAGTYPEDVTVRSSGTSDAPITFTAALGANVTLSGQTDGFYLSGRSWVTINGFNVINTTGYGIAVNTSSYITLSNNHVSYSGQPISGYTKYGIRLNAVTDSLVSQNTVDHNTNAGIGLVSGSTRNAVIGNVSFRNAEGYQRAAAGIHLYDAPGNTVASNISHDNEDSGINIYPGSSGCTVYDNVTYNNGDHGIDDSFAPNATIVANSVYKNVTAGINVEGGSTGATLANNISVDNGIKSPRTHSDIRVEHGSTDGTTLDYDLVYLTTTDTMLIWDSVSYTSLSAFQAASGQEAHGLQADPRWADPTSGDFRLLEGSPAIDSANSGAPAQPALDVYGNGRVDDPGTTNTGAGPRSYDDRGAYEYPAAAVDHIVISPSSATITAGASQTYTAQAFDPAGNLVSDVTAFTRFSSAPDGICMAATCTATTAGAHTVTGDDAGMTSTAVLTVNAGPLDHLVVTPASKTITASGSQAYTADGRDQYDNSLGDVTATTTFSISPNGSCTGATCTASTAGSHTVTGTKNGKTGTASLTVAAGPLDHLVLSPASATITSGGSQAYTAEGFDSSNNSLGDVTANTTFSISPNGSCTGATCTAATAGSHTVTGTDGSASATATLQVNASTLDHIVISPSSATITAGGSQTYIATAFDSANNSLGDVTATTTFTIAPDGSCTAATCTATTAGPHTVTGNSSGKTSTVALTVNTGPADHLVLSPGSASIIAGGSQSYVARSADQYGNVISDVTATTTFSISPDGSCSAAACTASNAGPHTVTGANAGKTGTASLGVTTVTVDHIVISPSSATIMSGGSQAYTAEGFDSSNNSLGDVTANTTFSISPNGSCTGATCTAATAGSHTVTGTDGSASATATLQVNASTLDHIVISPSSATITAGGSQTYIATAFDSANNSLGDVTATTTFTIAPDGSCTAATCTATTAGPHTVTGNSSGKTSTVALTVNTGPADHLVLSPGSASIIAGGSQSYVARSADQYGNVISDVTATTTFSISPDGSCSAAACTASNAGPHTVTGANAGKTGTATLQVNAGALDHISISPSTATISVGGSQTYTAQGFDAANNPLGDVTGSTSFAIAPDGSCAGSNCTANAGGPHTVTATDAGKTATASLAVSFIRNGGFETDLSGWNTSGSGSNITLARVSGGHTGGWAAKLTNTGMTTSTFATLQDSPNWVSTTVAGTYTAAIWVRADAPGAVLKLKLQEYTGSTLVASASSQITLTTDWQRVSLAYVVRSPGSTLDTQIYVANPPPGTGFYADDATIVLG